MEGLFQGSAIGLEAVKAADSFRPEPSPARARTERMGRRSQPCRQRCALLHRGGWCKCARQWRGCAMLAGTKGHPVHSDIPCFAAWTAERAGLCRVSIPVRVETPSPSCSRWAKPEMRVSIPCSRAQVSGIPSGERWDSVSDSACSIPIRNPHYAVPARPP